jgi:hypothetical protein
MAAKHDGDDLTAGQTNHEQSGFELVADPNEDGKFGGNYILQVVLSDGLFSSTPQIDGVKALVRDGRGVHGHSIENDGVVGTSGASNKSGVVGINDKNVGVSGSGSVAGVLGNSSGGNGVEGDSSLGVGVLGKSNTGNGVVGLSDSDSGVSGTSNSGVGVAGGSEGNDGVVGTSNAGAGVKGQAATGVGVYGLSTSGDGVRGDGLIGVVGHAKPIGGRSGVGVQGGAGDGIAVSGVAGLKGVGVLGASSDPRFPGRHGTAGVFLGALIVHGAKSAAVPYPDGSHRLLYSLESPESWFEDFGEGRLKDGKGKINLDPDFAKVVKTDKFHVFMTSYGDSRGLYVTNRTSKGFEVREQQGGKSSLTFSYRVVAKRKDIEGKRLAKVTLPPVPSLPKERKPPTRKTRSKTAKK